MFKKILFGTSSLLSIALTFFLCFMSPQEMLAYDGKGTLYGNDAGTSFCCCEGSNSCSASACDSTVCS